MPGTGPWRVAGRSYARRYHQHEIRLVERANHRRVRRGTRRALGRLTGRAGVAVEVADELLLDEPGTYDAAWDVV